MFTLPSKFENSASSSVLSVGRKIEHSRNCHQKQLHEQLHTDYQQRGKHCKCKKKRSKRSRCKPSFFERCVNFLLRLAPVGILVFGALEWHWIRSQERATQFQAMMYCSLPFRMMSKCWGWLASCELPESLRPHVYGLYSKLFNVNIEEALYTDLQHYKSVTEFFTRPLKSDARPIDAKAILVSPADGTVLHFSTASESMVEQVKGMTYHIGDFLGPPTWQKEQDCHLENKKTDFVEKIKHSKNNSTRLYQCVIYLAPGDYHRFHSPADWEPTYRRHFHGELLSVNPMVANWLPGLFCLNERVVYTGQWKHGFFSYTTVGATNVGSMQVYFDEHLETNRFLSLFKAQRIAGQPPYDDLKLTECNKGKKLLKKGELIGQFNMGSTIVLLFEAPKNFCFNLTTGQRVRVGESLIKA